MALDDDDMTTTPSEGEVPRTVVRTPTGTMVVPTVVQGRRCGGAADGGSGRRRRRRGSTVARTDGAVPTG